jgi:hypothetical protein
MSDSIFRFELCESEKILNFDVVHYNDKDNNLIYQFFYKKTDVSKLTIKVYFLINIVLC